MLIDFGFSVEKISIVAGIYILTAIILLFSIRDKLNPTYL
jgi:hypothetical protein